MEDIGKTGTDRQKMGTGPKRSGSGGTGNQAGNQRGGKNWQKQETGLNPSAGPKSTGSGDRSIGEPVHMAPRFSRILADRTGRIGDTPEMGAPVRMGPPSQQPPLKSSTLAVALANFLTVCSG
jgi:hypothetical protein